MGGGGDERMKVTQTKRCWLIIWMSLLLDSSTSFTKDELVGCAVLNSLYASIYSIAEQNTIVFQSVCFS